MCSKLIFKSKFGNGFSKREEKSVAAKKRVCEFFLGRIQMNLYCRLMYGLFYFANKEITLKTLYSQFSSQKSRFLMGIYSCHF